MRRGGKGIFFKLQGTQVLEKGSTPDGPGPGALYPPRLVCSASDCQQAMTAKPSAMQFYLCGCAWKARILPIVLWFKFRNDATGWKAHLHDSRPIASCDSSTVEHAAILIFLLLLDGSRGGRGGPTPGCGAGYAGEAEISAGRFSGIAGRFRTA